MINFFVIGMTCFLLLLILIIIGINIAIAFFVTGIIGVGIMIGFDGSFKLLGTSLYYIIATPSFASLPLFILMGALAGKTGFAKDAYDGISTLFGKIRGSLAIATCFGCAAFGTVSGSSLATAVLFGKIALPEMKRFKYGTALSVGVVAASGTFAAMIPPSKLFILYAIMTNQSVGKLFMAGLIPGIVTAIVYSLIIVVWVHRDPTMAPPVSKEQIKENSKWVNKFTAIRKIFPLLFVGFLILGGIYFGFFSPVEAGAAGTFIIFIIGILTKKFNTNDVREGLKESAKTTSMTFFIIIGALYFSRVIALSQVPKVLVNTISTLNIPSFYILSLVIMIWFFLGMFIISTGNVAITVPIVVPILTQLGYDPIWIGVICLKMMEIGAVTPPVGLNVYVLKGVVGDEVPINTIFKGIWPFVIGDFIVLILLILFPKIALFLPNLMW